MTHEEYESAITEKALQLSRGQPPEFNVAPTIELIKMAWRLGYDVIRKEEK